MMALAQIPIPARTKFSLLYDPFPFPRFSSPREISASKGVAVLRANPPRIT